MYTICTFLVHKKSSCTNSVHLRRWAISELERTTRERCHFFQFGHFLCQFSINLDIFPVNLDHFLSIRTLSVNLDVSIWTLFSCSGVFRTSYLSEKFTIWRCSSSSNIMSFIYKLIDQSYKN